MKRKRTKGLTCEKARAFPIERALAKLGHFPTRTTPKEAWFLSPFRSETQASFKVCKKLNRWYDHGAGKGGNVIDLICQINRLSVKDTLLFLSYDEPLFSFQQQPVFKGPVPGNEKVIITNVKPICHPALLGYIKSRGISISNAKSYCKEVHYRFKGKPYFAIGLQNHTGGWELRNKYLKNCTSPKDITLFQNGYDILTVTEGMFDLLSIVAHQPDLRQKSDFLVMNSTVLIQKAMQVFKGYSKIKLCLDNDSNGRLCTERLMEHRGAMDMSFIYTGHKDMNQWLMENGKNRVGQGIQDVFLLPQKQTCFTPDGRKEGKQ
ncbi:toprim domain-containing protein [uncultured Maribacter sp.]|uniref:toprim domain-containing protein n=1 Tax=uncultured Maribacter sp. TaxID=431308 RepID=UPI0030EDA6B7|tara:strand:+ start:2881 stop:3840 length:960 start_codon:yes stop_codon:yes gene_type:complete